MDNITDTTEQSEKLLQAVSSTTGNDTPFHSDTAIEGLMPPPATISGYLEARLPLAQIRANPDNPRRHFDAEELAGLAASIKASGVLQPIAVRYTGQAKAAFADMVEALPESAEHIAAYAVYQIIMGERRFRACGLAGLDTIPAMVYEVESDVDALFLALAENGQRASLNPIEEARTYQHLIEMGQTQERIGARVQKKQAEISKRVGLLRLPEEARDAIAAGKLSATHGVILCGIADDFPDAAQSYARRATDESWSTAVLSSEVAAYRLGQAEIEQAKRDASQPRFGGMDVDSAAAEGLSAEPVTTPPAAASGEAGSEFAQDMRRRVAEARASMNEEEEASAPLADREPDPDDWATKAAQARAEIEAPELFGDDGHKEGAEPSTPAPPSENPAPVAVKALPSVADVAPETTAPIQTGASRVMAGIAQDDDDWMFEHDLNIDAVFAHLRTQWDYRLTPVGRKALKALTGTYNDENPDAPVTPAARLERCLIALANKAGYDIETLKEIPE